MTLRKRTFLWAGLLALGAGSAAHADTWLETRISIEGLVAANDHAAAAVLSNELITQTTNTFGASSEELADAHLLLAHVLTLTGDHYEAAANILRAIEIHERNDGQLSARLIEPLVALGDAYYAAGEDALAFGSFEKARAISRRTFGVLNEDQIPILDKMARSGLPRLGFGKARDLQLEAVTLVQRVYGQNSLEYLDANYRYADWLMDAGAYLLARVTYQEMHDIIDDLGGAPVLRIRLLQTTAAKLREPRPIRTKSRELAQALEIVQSLEEPDPILHAAVLRDLGDWNVAQGRVYEVDEAYLEAWRILDGVNGGEDLQREWFGEQAGVRLTPVHPGGGPGPKTAPARVNVSFAIDARGWPRDIRVESSEPPGLVDDAAVRSIANARFRPRIDDGKLVASPDRFTSTYQFDPRIGQELQRSFRAANR